MASLNKVILMGNLTRDPDLRYTPNGVAVASFGLAVNRRYQQAEEWKDEVCFIDIVVFGRQAQPVSEYLSKGSPALVEGHLRWRSWEGQDGQKRSKHEIIAERVQFMPRTREDGMDRPGGGMERPVGGMDRAANNMGGMSRGMDAMDFPPPEDDIPF
jgi:single-strand DNA-binding protein